MSVRARILIFVGTLMVLAILEPPVPLAMCAAIAVYLLVVFPMLPKRPPDPPE